MTLEYLMEREKKIGKEIGEEIGSRTATERINRLNIYLTEAARLDDLIKAAQDPEYQNKLFEEFDL